MSVYKKILAVMEDVDYIMRDDAVTYGNTNYKGLREEVVTTTVRDAMVKHKLVVFPIEHNHRAELITKNDGKEMFLTTLDVKYRFVDTEDDTSVDVVSSGTGVDSQDKGVGKAMTYAYKYLFLRTFAIPTGEDPDRIASAEHDAEQAKLQEKYNNDRMQKGKETIKQMVADYENILPEAMLNDITENCAE